MTTLQNTKLNSWITARYADSPFTPTQPWLTDFRAQQLQKFLLRNFPTRREEMWKYTNVAQLENTYFTWPSTQQEPALKKNHDAICLTFINGQFSKKLSAISALPKEVVLCNLQTALDLHTDLIKPYLLREFDLARYPFAALNTALMTDGVFLYIPKGVTLKTPIHILFQTTEKIPTLNCLRNIIIANENSEAIVIEEYAGDFSCDNFTNIVTDIYAEKNSSLQFCKIQNENKHASHVASTFVQQKQDSRVTTFSISSGARLARDDLSLALTERGAECNVNGFYYPSEDGQHIDHHVHVDHLAEHALSDMLYKGILENKSRAVFNGKILVHKHAQQTQSHQANHNLLLSTDAEVDAKPELEIYADDVKCAHGATVGQLNEEALFYLRARGIAHQEAVRLLTRAFAADIINRAQHPLIAARIHDVFGEKLA